MWRRRIAQRLLPGAWRLIAVEREPPVEVLGTYAVRAITRVTDRVHADALGLIDELLAVGADARRCACHGRRRSEPYDPGESGGDRVVIGQNGSRRPHET